MQVSIDMQTVGVIVGWVATIVTLVWHAAGLAARVKVIEKNQADMRAEFEKDVAALGVRVDAHDDVKERVARIEQGVQDMRGLLQQLVARKLAEAGKA